MSTRLSRTPGVLLASMVAAACFLVTAPAAVASFSGPTQFGVGTGPETVTLGDLNGDGHLDSVTPYSTIGKISVLLGNGDGTFDSRADLSVGNSPTSIAIANVNSNSDSFPDLVVTNSGDDTISILLGDGTGSFSAPVNIAIGDYPVYVAAGKFNDDDAPDLVVANQNSGNISVLIGHGDGTFTSSVITTGAGARSVAIGDLNHDGKSDLAVANSGSGEVTILLGNGGGQFGSPTGFSVGSSAFSVAMGDFDGDSFADLAVARNVYDGDQIAVLINDGTGGFGAATRSSAGMFPRTVAVGNLVGDGALDLVAANSGSYLEPETRVSVFAGEGDGGFAPKVDYPAGTDPSGVAIGDLDSDRNPDLVASGNAEVSVLLNQAPTATAAPSTLAFPDQAVNTTAGELPVAVTNSSGGDPLDVNGFSIDGPNAADFEVKSQTCTADPVPFDGDCAIQIDFTPSAPGARDATLEVTYNGAESPLKAPLTGTGIDVTPPDTVIDSGPSGTITSDSATFTFHGDPADDTVKIMCKLDSGSFADCTSPKTYSGLADGSHTVAFRAQDSAGNQDPTPANRAFTVKKAVSPVAKAKIGKVKVNGPPRVKKGKKGTYKVTVTNSGNASATGVKIKISGKGVACKKKVGQIPAGKTRSLKVKCGFRQAGKVKIIFKVTSSNAGTRSVKKTVKVRS